MAFQERMFSERSGGPQSIPSKRVFLNLRTRLSGWVKIDFRLLALALVLSRLAVLAVRVAWLPGPGDPNDLRYFLDMARLSDQGLYPYVQFWAEYPPVFPWIIVGAYKLSLSLASGPTAERLFYVLLIGLLVACEVGGFWLLYRLAVLLQRSELRMRPARASQPPARPWPPTARLHVRKRPAGRAGSAVAGPEPADAIAAATLRGPAWRSASIFLLAFVPCYLWTGWFDALPVFLLLAALYLLLTGRELLSALAVGLGIVSKLFPLMVLPVAVCTLPGLRRQARYALIAGAVVALFTVPFFVANPSMTLASIYAAFVRPSWETIWALFDRYYSWGVIAPLAQHVDPASAHWSVHTTRLPWPLITLVFGALFALFYFRFYGNYGLRQPRRILAAVAFTLTLLMLYSKGYSPQYIMWLAPLLVILLPNRQGATYLALWGVLNLVEILLYISYFPQEHWILVPTVLARTALLVILARAFLRQALVPGTQPLLARRARSVLTHGWRSGT